MRLSRESSVLLNTTRLFLEFYVRNHRQALNEARPINKENKAFFLPSDPDWIAETEEENFCGDENRGGGFYSWARYSYTLRENCLLFFPIRKQSTEGLKLWYLRHPDIHCHCGGMRNMTVISTFLYGTSEMNAKEELLISRYFFISVFLEGRQSRKITISLLRKFMTEEQSFPCF